MTPEELDAIEQRAARAAPGPWAFEPDIGERDWHGFPVHATVNGHYGFTDDDACFIAAARDDVPALLAEVRHLQASVSKMGPMVDAFRRARLACKAVKADFVDPEHVFEILTGEIG